MMGYGECSALLHSSADILNSPLPAPPFIQNKIDALRQWITDIRKRQEKTAVKVGVGSLYQQSAFSRCRSSDTWHQIKTWLACLVVRIFQPTERHREVLGSLLTDTLTRSNFVPEAHLATLAIEHGLTLYSADRDF